MSYYCSVATCYVVVRASASPARALPRHRQGTDNRVKGTENHVKGTDNRVKGTDNHVKGAD